MGKIKVVIVDDHAVVREGLKILVQADPRIEVAGEAGDGRQAVHLAIKVCPDVVIMDLMLPRMNGLQATRRILRERPQSKILVLSSSSNDECVRELLQAGAAGYLTKHSASEDLLEAIRQVNAGKTFFSSVIGNRLRRQANHARAQGQPGNQLPHLTQRQREVLKLVAEGRSNKQIALLLRVSAKTVEKHRQEVMNKLDVHDVAGLTRYAISQGLLAAFPQQEQRL